MKKGLAILLTITMLFGLVGCAEKIRNVDVSSIDVARVVVKNTDSSDKHTFGATALPAEAYDKTLEYSISYTADQTTHYATIDGNTGVVTFAGVTDDVHEVYTVTITSKMNPTISKVCYISINYDAPKDASDFGAITDENGVTLTDLNGNFVQARSLKTGSGVTSAANLNFKSNCFDKVTYSSSDESVVSVYANGDLYALKAGEATITITSVLPFQVSTAKALQEGYEYAYASTSYKVVVNALTTSSDLKAFLANEGEWEGITSAYLTTSANLNENITVSGSSHKTLTLNGNKIEFDADGTYTTDSSLFNVSCSTEFVIDGTKEGSTITATRLPNVVSFFKTSGTALKFNGGNYNFSAVQTTGSDFVCLDIDDGKLLALNEGASVICNVAPLNGSAVYGVNNSTATVYLQENSSLTVNIVNAYKVPSVTGSVYGVKADNVVVENSAISVNGSNYFAYGIYANDCTVKDGSSVFANGGSVSNGLKEPKSETTIAVSAKSCDISDSTLTFDANNGSDAVGVYFDGATASSFVNTKFVGSARNLCYVTGNATSPTNFTNCEMVLNSNVECNNLTFFDCGLMSDVTIYGGTYENKTSATNIVFINDEESDGTSAITIGSQDGYVPKVSLKGRNVYLIESAKDTSSRAISISGGNYTLEATSNSTALHTKASSVKVTNAVIDVTAGENAWGFKSIDSSYTVANSELSVTGKKAVGFDTSKDVQITGNYATHAKVSVNGTDFALAVGYTSNSDASMTTTASDIGAVRIGYIEKADIEVNSKSSCKVGAGVIATKYKVYNSYFDIDKCADVIGLKNTGSSSEAYGVVMNITGATQATAFDTVGVTISNKSVSTTYQDVVVNVEASDMAILVNGQTPSTESYIRVSSGTFDVTAGNKAIGFAKLVDGVVVPTEEVVSIDNGADFTMKATGENSEARGIYSKFNSTSIYSIFVREAAFDVSSDVNSVVFETVRTNSNIGLKDVTASAETKSKTAVSGACVVKTTSSSLAVYGGEYTATVVDGNDDAGAYVFNVEDNGSHILKLNPDKATVNGCNVCAVTASNLEQIVIGGEYYANGVNQACGLNISGITGTYVVTDDTLPLEILADTKVEVNSKSCKSTISSSTISPSQTAGIMLSNADLADAAYRKSYRNACGEFTNLPVVVLHEGLDIDVNTVYGNTAGLKLSQLNTYWYNANSDIDVTSTGYGNVVGIDNSYGNIHFISDVKTILGLTVDVNLKGNGSAYAISNGNNGGIVDSYIDVYGDAIFTFTANGEPDHYQGQTIENDWGKFYSYVNGVICLSAEYAHYPATPNQYTAVFEFDNVKANPDKVVFTVDGETYVVNQGTTWAEFVKDVDDADERWDQYYASHTYEDNIVHRTTTADLYESWETRVWDTYSHVAQANTQQLVEQNDPIKSTEYYSAITVFYATEENGKQVLKEYYVPEETTWEEFVNGYCEAKFHIETESAKTADNWDVKDKVFFGETATGGTDISHVVYSSRSNLTYHQINYVDDVRVWEYTTTSDIVYVTEGDLLIRSQVYYGGIHFTVDKTNSFNVAEYMYESTTTPYVKASWKGILDRDILCMTTHTNVENAPGKTGIVLTNVDQNLYIYDEAADVQSYVTTSDINTTVKAGYNYSLYKQFKVNTTTTMSDWYDVESLTTWDDIDGTTECDSMFVKNDTEDGVDVKSNGGHIYEISATSPVALSAPIAKEGVYTAKWVVKFTHPTLSCATPSNIDDKIVTNSDYIVDFDPSVTGYNFQYWKTGTTTVTTTTNLAAKPITSDVTYESVWKAKSWTLDVIKPSSYSGSSQLHGIAASTVTLTFGESYATLSNLFVEHSEVADGNEDPRIGQTCYCYVKQVVVGDTVKSFTWDKTNDSSKTSLSNNLNITLVNVELTNSTKVYTKWVHDSNKWNHLGYNECVYSGN